MTEPIKKYNSKGKLIYRKYSDGDEFWYNNIGKIIHYKDSYNFEDWREYDENNNQLFYYNTENRIYWKKYPFFVEDQNKIIFR
jgi:hypothetical protein